MVRYKWYVLKRFASLAAIFTFCFTVNINTVDATTGSLAFLSIVPAARPASMGGAFTAISDDINTIFMNPAGLGNLQSKVELLGTYNSWFEGITYMCIAGCYSIESLATTVGVSGIFLNYGDLLQTEEVGGNIKDTGKKFQPQDLVINVAAGREIVSAKLYVGVAGKILSESIGPVSSSGFGLDAGVLYKAVENANIGFAVQNLGVSAKFEDKTFSAPLSLRVGGMYKWKFTEKAALVLAGDVALYGKDTGIYLGSELSYPISEDFLLRLRGGYQVGKILSNFSIGGGMIYKSEATDILIDIGYVPVKELGDTLRIGVGVRM